MDTQRQESGTNKAALSTRAAAVSRPGVPYLHFFLTATQDVFDPDTNSNGYVVLAVAENKLAWPLLAPLFNESATEFPGHLAGPCTL